MFCFYIKARTPSSGTHFATNTKKEEGNGFSLFSFPPLVLYYLVTSWSVYINSSSQQEQDPGDIKNWTGFWNETEANSIPDSPLTNCNLGKLLKVAWVSVSSCVKWNTTIYLTVVSWEYMWKSSNTELPQYC